MLFVDFSRYCQGSAGVAMVIRSGQNSHMRVSLAVVSPNSVIDVDSVLCQNEYVLQCR